MLFPDQGFILVNAGETLFVTLVLTNGFFFVNCKLQESLYRPGQALKVVGGRCSQISRQSAHECGKVVSPTHWPHLLNGEYFW